MMVKIICENCGCKYKETEYAENVCFNCGQSEENNHDDEFVYKH